MLKFFHGRGIRRGRIRRRGIRRGSFCGGSALGNIFRGEAVYEGNVIRDKTFLHQFELFTELSVINDGEEGEEHANCKGHNRAGREGDGKVCDNLGSGFRHHGCKRAAGRKQRLKRHCGNDVENPTRERTEPNGELQLDCVILHAKLDKNFQDEVNPSEEGEKNEIGNNLHALGNRM